VHTTCTLFFAVIADHAANTACTTITVWHASFLDNFAIDVFDAAVTAISAYIAVTEILCATNTATMNKLPTSWRQVLCHECHCDFCTISGTSTAWSAILNKWLPVSLS
jgi:hypothetical protein